VRISICSCYRLCKKHMFCIRDVQLQMYCRLLLIFFVSICVNAVILTCIFGNKFCLCFPFLFKANASSNEPVAICFNYQRISICGIGTQ
jgi:hypothetical protein